MASQAQLGIGSSSSDPHAGQPHTVMQRRSKIVATGVSFQQRLSVFSAGNDFEIEDHAVVEGEEFEVSMETRSWWVFVAENIYFRQFFRAVSVVNLIVLVLSIPFYNLNQLEGNQEFIVSTQFQVITVLDFILSCIYTFNFVLRIIYNRKITKRNDKRPLSPEEDKTMPINYADSFRSFTALLLMLSMWYSVGIGIYHSMDVNISMWWYVGYAPRTILAVFPALNLLLKVESSAVQKLSGLLKWKQLAMVTGFYFIFVFIFALTGIHIIGGLDHFCTYRTVDEDGNFSTVLAIPLQHCTPEAESRTKFCDLDTGNNTGLVCLQFPPRDISLFFDYRSYVYYGQFRSILDALYAVYEASTLELWSFMMYSAIGGRSLVLPVLFYLFLVLFVVILLQQSIFLVVIIESFADLRDQSLFFWMKKSSSQKTQTKPKTVLTLEDPATNTLKLSSLETDTSAKFLDNYSKFLVYFEKVFLVLVMIDAIVTATKHANMKYKEHAIALQVWQGTVSVLFVIEIGFVFLFHLYHGQWKLFFRRPYYLCLTVLAIGGVVASIPIDINGFYFYNPLLPGSALAIFQAFRFPRLLRCSESLLNFIVKITGRSIPILSVVTLVMICWLSLFNAQLLGYTNSSPEECSIGQHFATFPESFGSTFQIVMNEAWTDVTSEVMCRSKYWFVTNFYFIVIHLFSSLIFLNFFGAVILDNLEYDEEEKKAKLEKIKKKEAEFKETVPYRLKIFEKLGNEPKKLKPPPGIGGDDPKLDEVEVRKFFDTAHASNIVSDSHDLSSLHAHLPDPAHSNGERRKSSILHDLSLVSYESNDLVPSKTSEVHGIYNSILSLLSYISLWKKYNEEEQSRDPKGSHIHYLFGQSPYEKKEKSKLIIDNYYLFWISRSSNIRSEYEVFKEKHRYFDMALFCMPPEHKLRRFCTKLLKAQAEAPRYVPIQGKGQVLQVFRKRISFVFRWIVSRMPYSTWIMFLSLCVIVATEVFELSDESNRNHTYTPPIEVFYLLLMLSWLVTRVISRGCFLNPNAAINSVWDVVDWILVLDSALLLLLLPLWIDKDVYHWFSFDINIAFFSPFYKTLYVIRCLRPLHAISVLNSLRAVVREIVEGWKNLFKGAILLLGFMFMFASLGVQLFAGTEKNPLAFCNDPRITVIEECVGEFVIKVDASREFLPMNSTDFPVIEMLAPRVWYPFARDFPFNNVPFAFITLFELLTLEGWSEVRDMLPERNQVTNLYMRIYIHIFVFFAVNIGLQLFLGIVVNNFNEHKPGHTFLLSVEQNRWSELMQRVSLQRPYKLPPEPRDNKIRRKLYRILTHHSFRIIPTIITTLLALTLVVPWDVKLVGEECVLVLVSFSILLNLYTVLEIFLKLLVFSTSFFQSWRNLFDFILSFLTIAYTIFALIALMNSSSELYNQVSYFALAIAVMKLITVMVKYSAMLNLLLTVLSTLLRSASLVAVLFVISLCYALLGVVFFSSVRTGEAIDYDLVNFAGSSTSLSAVWRSFTGEDWYQLMWDAAVRPPYCDDQVLKNCADPLIAIVFFCSFTFIVPFILLNVFIAVLLENFAIFYNDEETNLDLVAMKDFKRKWRIFDLLARGHIPIRRVKLLLRSLDLQSYYTFVPGDAGHTRELDIHNKLIDDSLLLWEMEEELLQEAVSFVSKTPSESSPHDEEPLEIYVEFLNVLRMLAYRCEDINKRLEPQELFARKELEQTIQLDVAENCILKWIKKRVRPVVKMQREMKEASLQADNQQKQQPLLAKEKRQQLFALHTAQQSAQFLDVQSWGQLHSIDTEDEDQSTESKRLSWSQHLHASSEEKIDYYGIESMSANETSSSRSFNKIKQNYTPGTGNEKTKEWFKTQQEWMDKVDSDLNYFDDHL